MAKHPLLRALSMAGVSRPEGSIGWHDLRYTYGSHLTMRGVVLKEIQELIGHTTIEMTMRTRPITRREGERSAEIGSVAHGPWLTPAALRCLLEPAPARKTAPVAPVRLCANGQNGCRE